MIRAFFYIIFYISRTNSKTSKVNQKSVWNTRIEIFHNFPKNLDRTVIFNSVALKNTQTEPQKYILFFQRTNNT